LGYSCMGGDAPNECIKQATNGGMKWGHFNGQEN
jgi:hypothetical protein